MCSWYSDFCCYYFVGIIITPFVPLLTLPFVRYTLIIPIWYSVFADVTPMLCYLHYLLFIVIFWCYDMFLLIYSDQWRYIPLIVDILLVFNMTQTLLCDPLLTISTIYYTVCFFGDEITGDIADCAMHYSTVDVMTVAWYSDWRDWPPLLTRYSTIRLLTFACASLSISVECHWSIYVALIVVDAICCLTFSVEYRPVIIYDTCPRCDPFYYY